jgi:dihydroorotate dehydrogenase
MHGEYHGWDNLSGAAMPLLPPVILARLDSKLRPVAVRLPPGLAVRLYSAGRRSFLDALAAERPEPREPPRELSRTLWGLRFRSPLGNAAGMFKNGDGYEVSWRQGAGYWLAGTTTASPRGGNLSGGWAGGVAQPFVPYPRSGAASNWLGLPNDGDEAVAVRIAEVVRSERREGCPVGVSAAAVAGADEGEAVARLDRLVRGLKLFQDAGADFLEINESCPNTGESESDRTTPADLSRRLERVAEGFLVRRERPLPVIVKFSVDTAPERVPGLVDTLVELGFDGVDFGNTSTDYAGLRAAVDPAERRLYDQFTGRFGGGVSGRPLRERSLALARAAADRARQVAPVVNGERVFHVVRTGGVEAGADLAATESAGVALAGWLTGYFEGFARHGHDVYRTIYEQALSA